MQGLGLVEDARKTSSNVIKSNALYQNLIDSQTCFRQSMHRKNFERERERETQPIIPIVHSQVVQKKGLGLGLMKLYTSLNNMKEH